MLELEEQIRWWWWWDSRIVLKLAALNKYVKMEKFHV